MKPMDANKDRVVSRRKKRGVHKRLSLLCICVFVMLTVIASASATNVVLESAVINNPNSQNRLNLRAQNTESAELLGRYYNGVVVDVLEYTPNDWVRIRIGAEGQGVIGYMAAKYLALGTAGSSVVSAIPVYQSTAVTWTLKAMPFSKGISLGEFGTGEQVELLGFTDSWWHIRVKNQTGYVQAHPQFLKLISGDPNFDSVGEYYDGYRIAIVNNPNPADRLNLRKTANRNAASLGKYYNGVVTAILDEQTNWLKVRIGNLEGYMESQYLAIDAHIGSIASAKPAVKVSNSSESLNLREKQSQSSKSLELYNNGTSLEVLGLTERWCHVQVDGKVGFMMADYLSSKLKYTASVSNNTDSTTGDSWRGPAGKHRVAEWTIKIADYLGVVNNPDSNDRLHLRVAPDKSAKSLGKYYNGVRVVIMGESDGEWTKVDIGNLEGYMMTEFLVIGEVPGQEKPASAMPIVVVNNPNAAGNLLLREKQSVNSASLGVYKNGTEVTLMGFNGEWAHVIADGNMGFMQGKYLK